MSSTRPTPQRNLFDWLNDKIAPSGAVSSAGLADVEVDHDGVRQLHRSLENSLGTVDLVVTNNRRRMVTAKKRRGRHEIRVHHMFVGADPGVVRAVAGLARGDDHARATLRAFIAENHDEIKPREPAGLQECGQTHDLGESLQRAMAEDALRGHDLSDVTVGWGRFGRGSRSIRFGSFDFEQRLVRLHPVLDQPWVPEYFVDFVTYHELLHAIVPPRRSAGGRRVLHPPEFRELERAFSRYEEAIAWERDNLQRLLNR